MVIKKNVKIAVPLKHLSIFWGTFEMPLINCEINPILSWSEDRVISPSTGETKFGITKLYGPVLTVKT